MKVKVIQRKGHAALVEWLDGAGSLRRATVPLEAVVNDEVDESDLDMGIEYGLPWAELVTLRVTPERIERELRKHGIWTHADLRARPNVAAAALQAAYAVNLTALRQAAERLEKEK